MIPIHLVLPAAEEFPPNAIPIKVHHIWKFINFFRILIFFYVNTSRHTLFVDLPNNSTVSLFVCTFSLLYPNTSSKHKISGPAMAKVVDEKPIRILVPDKSFDLEQKPAEGLYNELSKCTPKTLAYFDEVIQIYVITSVKIESKLKLELGYSTDRNTSLCQSEPVAITKSYKIWMFEVRIEEGKSRQLSIRAWYENKEEAHDKILEDFEPLDELIVYGIKLESETQSVNNEAEPKLVSYEVSLAISPLFQLVFKNIKSEKVFISLDVCACRELKNASADIIIKKINVEVTNCEIIEYSKIKYPVHLVPESKIALAYVLSSTDNNHIKPVTALITSTVDGFKEIETEWTANIDFQKPYYNPGTQSLRNFSTPLLMQSRSPSRSASSVMLSVHKRYGFKYKSNSSTSVRSSSQIIRGLTLSVSGKTQVKLSEAFKWKIQLINKSSTKMDLILYIQSSVKKQYEKSLVPISVQNSHSTKDDPVPLYKNSQLVRAFYHKFNKVGLVSLTNNLRMNLEPGNLFETELQLVAIERGLFTLRDIKILDANTGDTFGCPRLLDVLVV